MGVDLDAGKRLAVVGAGPIGLELALGAAQRGIKVEVFEKGTSSGAGVKSWQHVTLFSAWSFNIGEAGRTALSEQGVALPDAGEYPSGQEFVSYLEKLALALRAHDNCLGLHFGAEVLHVGRGKLLKGDSIGGGEMRMPQDAPLCKHQRSETPFRLLVREGDKERYAEGFQLVADCSGVYGRPEQANWVGAGGVPALGERALRDASQIWLQIPDILGKDRARFAARRTLVVGGGYSAATCLNFLLQLAKEEPNTAISWATRRGGVPYTVIEDDILPARKELCLLGNSIAKGVGFGIDYIAGSAVQAISRAAAGHLEVELEVHGKGQPVTKEVDEVIACVGYHPDSSLYQELQVHQCYATDGPIKLAATLLGASGDCMKQSAAGVDVLRNPEPNFFVLGSKSYGRSSAFLLKIGYSQVEEVLNAIVPPDET
mmetsp:Transcript_30897/g.67676  ORF Transcript_30897/g.67676 Transcript_30897/m.67676 type:complete len:430 (-) Transcript_30897:90-1379(-)